MTKVERLFFHFLRNGLWGGCSGPGIAVGDDDWAELFRLSCRQAVSGIVADGIAATDVRPPSGLWQEWVFGLLHIEMVNGEMARCGESLLGMLASEGVKASVFKGTSVAAWYPEPLHRSYGDIDIVVHEGWGRLEDVLRSRGVPYFYENGDIVVGQSGGAGRYRIEFHPVYETLYNPFMDARLRRIVSCRRPSFGGDGDSSPELYLACLILHLRRHVLSYGIGMKQVCDVAVMLRNASVDTAGLKRMLRHLGAWHFSRALFRFIDVYLYADKPVQADQEDDDTAVLYNIFMNDGYVLKAERESIGSSMRLSPLRVVRNGCFWTKRSLRLFRLMPGEAFFFVFDKTVRRIMVKKRLKGEKVKK